MPTYVYRREDGTTFEVQQRITETALETCPTTGQKVSRVISGAGLIFKGEGFYLTDYARKSNGGSKASETKASESKSSESKPEAKSTDSGGKGSGSTEAKTAA